MVTTRRAKKIAESEGKVLSPLRKLDSPKRGKRGSSAAAKDAKKKKEEAEKEDAEKELLKAKQDDLKEEEIIEVDIVDEDESESDDEVEIIQQDEGNKEQNEEQEEESSNDEDMEGFESTDDEEEEQDNQIEKNEEDTETPKQKQKKEKKIESHEVKQLPKTDKSSQKQSKSAEKGGLYIGRLPQGFEESELKKYFNQFGTITKVVLPRSKKTGNIKHYAFVEFTSRDDAAVAQETMNNYLIMNHQLKVNLLEGDLTGFFASKPKKERARLNWKTAEIKNKIVKQSRDKRANKLKAAGIKW